MKPRPGSSKVGEIVSDDAIHYEIVFCERAEVVDRFSAPGLNYLVDKNVRNFVFV